ncbi:MAG TPA: hypothetical protein VLY04_24060 [Bryobacteraceae bacterium]|nr:hypothetical protein [Bryobacteraceae bacterium]
MPHLRLQVPEEWLREEFRAATGFDARKLLDHLVQAVAGLRMENPAIEARRQALLQKDPNRVVTEQEARSDEKGNPIPELVPMINLRNLKHAIEPLYYAHVAGDPAQRFLHATLAAGNDTPGRTAAVRRRAAETLGEEIDRFVGDLPGLSSVTVHVEDIDRDRGYSTTGERKKARSQKAAL